VSLLSVLGLLSLLLVVWFTALAYGGSDHTVGGRQNRRQAIVEVWIGILVGFAINFSLNLVLLPLVGATFTLMDNFFLGCIYTLVAVIRSYSIRRWADERIHHFAARAAQGIS